MSARRTHPGLLLTAVAAVVLGLTVVGGAPAAGPEAGLGAAGEVYVVREGPLGQLFPGVPAAAADHVALALEIHYPGSEPELLLVPDTDGPEIESTPFLFIDGASEAAFLVWESRKHQIFSRINLVGYSPAGWSEVVELSGDFFSFKQTPRIAVTRDSYVEVDAAGRRTTHHRTVCHTVWWEEAGAGRRSVYSPVILENGRFQGPNPVFLLADFDPSRPAWTWVPDSLAQAPTIAAGRSELHAVATFANPDTGRIATVELAVVPQAVRQLSAAVHSEIARAAGEDDRRSLADRARAHIEDVGLRLRYHPDIVRHLAVGVAELVLAAPAGESPVSLADRARAHIEDVGARLAARGQTDFGYQDPTALVEIPAATAGGASTLILMRRASTWAVPAELGEGPFSVYSSASGDDLLLAWEQEGQVLYWETQGETWSELRALSLGPDFDRDAAHRLLERRARSR